ncbi:MAG: mycofactocin precursor MftA [Actinomycetota bacterium]|jgi:mycofactocin precursor|nr:mycofactocin precursor MftA [Actinomycetota bacterium]
MPTTETEPLFPSGTPAGSFEVGSSDSSDIVEDELLVEEISIDGMCGVY